MIPHRITSGTVNEFTFDDTLTPRMSRRGAPPFKPERQRLSLMLVRWLTRHGWL